MRVFNSIIISYPTYFVTNRRVLSLSLSLSLVSIRNFLNYASLWGYVFLQRACLFIDSIEVYLRKHLQGSARGP